mgnify:FL=1
MKFWTHAEEEALRHLAHLGARHLSVAFDRSIDSIKWKAGTLGLSLRRRESHTDSTPCGEATIRRIRALLRADLCPACGKRAIGVRSTGLCGPCHYEKLREVHEEAIAEREAQRRLWAARSKLHRLRGEEPDEPDLEESLC